MSHGPRTATQDRAASPSPSSSFHSSRYIKPEGFDEKADALRRRSAINNLRAANVNETLQQVLVEAGGEQLLRFYAKSLANALAAIPATERFVALGMRSDGQAAEAIAEYLIHRSTLYLHGGEAAASGGENGTAAVDKTPLKGPGGGAVPSLRGLGSSPSAATLHTNGATSVFSPASRNSALSTHSTVRPYRPPNKDTHVLSSVVSPRNPRYSVEQVHHDDGGPQSSSRFSRGHSATSRGRAETATTTCGTPRSRPNSAPRPAGTVLSPSEYGRQSSAYKAQARHLASERDLSTTRRERETAKLQARQRYHSERRPSRSPSRPQEERTPVWQRQPARPKRNTASSVKGRMDLRKTFRESPHRTAYLPSEVQRKAFQAEHSTPYGTALDPLMSRAFERLEARRAADALVSQPPPRTGPAGARPSTPTTNGGTKRQRRSSATSPTISSSRKSSVPAVAANRKHSTGSAYRCTSTELFPDSRAPDERTEASDNTARPAPTADNSVPASVEEPTASSGVERAATSALSPQRVHRILGAFHEALERHAMRPSAWSSLTAEDQDAYFGLWRMPQATRQLVREQYGSTAVGSPRG